MIFNENWTPSWSDLREHCDQLSRLKWPDLVVGKTRHRDSFNCCLKCRFSSIKGYIPEGKKFFSTVLSTVLLLPHSLALQSLPDFNFPLNDIRVWSYLKFIVVSLGYKLLCFHSSSKGASLLVSKRLKWQGQIIKLASSNHQRIQRHNNVYTSGSRLALSRSVTTLYDIDHKRDSPILYQMPLLRLLLSDPVFLELPGA